MQSRDFFQAKPAALGVGNLADARVAGERVTIMEREMFVATVNFT